MLPNFNYIVINKRTGERRERSIQIKWNICDSYDLILSTIMTDFLVEIRVERFMEITRNFRGDLRDNTALEKYLPEEYKKYARDIDALIDQMASLYEIRNNYEIQLRDPPSGFNNTKCFGCLSYSPAQIEHMDPQTGCLSNPY
jgi:hypothetical protein